MLKKLIDLEKDTLQGIFGLGYNTGVLNTFNNYADSEDKDGQWVAQAILLAACDSTYTEPHTYPEGEAAPRMMMPQANLLSEGASINEDNTRIAVYPNPTKAGVNLQYSSRGEGQVKVELRDLLGKLIYTNFISNNFSEQYIPMTGLSGGMYLLTITKNNKEVIFKTKVIKEE